MIVTHTCDIAHIIITATAIIVIGESQYGTVDRVLDDDPGNLGSNPCSAKEIQ